MTKFFSKKEFSKIVVAASGPPGRSRWCLGERRAGELRAGERHAGEWRAGERRAGERRAGERRARG